MFEMTTEIKMSAYVKTLLAGPFQLDVESLLLILLGATVQTEVKENGQV